MKNRLSILTLFVLLFCFSPQIVTAQSKSDKTKAKEVSAQAITGYVYDEEGEPLIGVAVRNVKSKSGTMTDASGFFSIKATSPQKVSFTYLGKDPLEMTITPGKAVKVTMKDGEHAIEEVVVTGIYTRKKDSFTGSAQTFSADDLKMVGNANLLQSLKQLDASFNMMDNNQFGSDPNRLPDIEIRGKSSIVGLKEQYGSDPNQPLFILDGFETTLQTIMDMSLDRIASVTLLKDAASTAIYGAKAANGVVVVETKAPVAGRIQLSYNGSFDFSWADLSDYNLMNAAEKLEFERLSGNFESNIGTAQEFQKMRYNRLLADVQRGVDTYWLSEPLRNGFYQRHNVSLQGGSQELKFLLGLDYKKNNAVMKGSTRDIFSGDFTITYRISKLQFTNKTTVDYMENTNPLVSFYEYANANPYYRKYNENGGIDRWLERPNQENSSTDASVWAANPLYNASLNSYDKGNYFYVRNNFNMMFTPTDYLKVNARVSVSKTTDEAEKFKSPEDTSFEQVELLKKGSYSDSRSDGFSWNADLSAEFAQVFNQAHTVYLVAGASVQESKSKNKTFEAQGFPEGNFNNPGFSNSYPDGSKPRYTESTYRNANFYLNAHYSYKNKYLADFNLRADGTSVFGSNRQFTNTWSVGLAWSLGNEEFIKDNTDIVQMLKIRGSVGNPGNQGFGSFNSVNTYQYNNWMLNNFGTGLLVDGFGDPNLKWQKTLNTTIGIDVTLWQRLSFNIDYYYKDTDPLIARIDIPSSVGTTSRFANIGRQVTRGIDGRIQYSILYNPKQRINWTVSATFSHDKSEYRDIGSTLSQYNNENLTKNLTRYYDGGSPTALWTVRSAGIDPATGKEIFITPSGEYTFNHSYDYEVVVGDTTPKLRGYLGSSFMYKGLSVGVNFEYRFGGYALNSTLYNKIENITRSGLLQNQDKRALYDRWQKPGDEAQFKGIRETTTINPITSRFVQKDDMIRLASVSLNYQVPTEWVNKIGLQGMTLAAYMNDIARWSTIKDERGTSYPFSRSISFSIGFNL